MVTGLWDHLSLETGSRKFDKASAYEMQVISLQLDKMGVLDKELFLHSFTTTIGKSIYFPFEPGVETAEFPLLSQCCIIAHEHQHVFQLAQDHERFAWMYIYDKNYRANQEADALMTSMEVYYYLTGIVRNPKEMAQHLIHYNCSTDQIAVVEQHLAISKSIVAKNGIETRSGKMTISYLKTYEGLVRP